MIDVDIMGKITKPLTHVKLTPRVDEGQMRFVLSWPDGPKDLDLHTSFKLNRFLACSCYFGRRECPGVSLDVDSYNGGASGGETITISTLGQYIYTISINKFEDFGEDSADGETPVAGSVQNNNNKNNQTIPDTPLPFSNAKISVYVYNYVGPIFEVAVPSVIDASTTDGESTNPDDYTWWLGFCLNGRTGINSLTPMNKLYTEQPNFSICEKHFGLKPSPF